MIVAVYLCTQFKKLRKKSQLKNVLGSTVFKLMTSSAVTNWVMKAQLEKQVNFSDSTKSTLRCTAIIEVERLPLFKQWHHEWLLLLITHLSNCKGKTENPRFLFFFGFVYLLILLICFFTNDMLRVMVWRYTWQSRPQKHFFLLSRCGCMLRTEFVRSLPSNHKPTPPGLMLGFSVI